MSLGMCSRKTCGRDRSTRRVACFRLSRDHRESRARRQVSIGHDPPAAISDDSRGDGGYEATQNVAGHAFAPGAERLRTEAAPESRVNPAYLRGARRCRAAALVLLPGFACCAAMLARPLLLLGPRSLATLACPPLLLGRSATLARPLLLLGAGLMLDVPTSRRLIGVMA